MGKVGPEAMGAREACGQYLPAGHRPAPRTSCICGAVRGQHPTSALLWEAERGSEPMAAGRPGRSADCQALTAQGSFFVCFG